MNTAAATMDTAALNRARLRVLFGWVVVLAIFAALLAAILQNQRLELWLNYVDELLIYASFAIGANLLLGYAGQVSVAFAAFGAVGGYAMGWLVQQHNVNFVIGTGIGMILALVAGSIIALPALRLTVEFLILLTLAISSVIIGFFTTFPSLGGTYGIIGLPRPQLFGLHLDNPRDWVIPLLVVTILIYLLSRRMGESPFGRVLKGIREDDRATRALGKNVVNYKVAVFGISSALAAAAGGFYAAWLNLSTPGVFGFQFSLTIFAIVIFGGLANLGGSIVGAAAVVLLEPILQKDIHLKPERAGLVQLIVYGLALVILMRLRPQGVFPEGFSLWRRIRRGKEGAARVEMVSTENWVPSVSVGTHGAATSASDLALDDAEVARERQRENVWQNAPVVLEVHGLSKRFGGIVAAADLDMVLKKGTITALVGPNGAGKTTVFNLLTNFIRPDSGVVHLNGAELTGKTPDKIARLGMVRTFQDVRLINRLSCLSNVMLAVQRQPGENLGKLFFGGPASRNGERETREKAMKWLTFVGMQDFADVPAGAVSYGQSKLISLARVLATEAEVLLLDEPASGIDTKWVDTMLALIEEVREQGRTVCIVEHNLHVVGRLADHTYFMELGRITAQGTIEELTNTPRLAEAYFGTV